MTDPAAPRMLSKEKLGTIRQLVADQASAFPASDVQGLLAHIAAQDMNLAALWEYISTLTAMLSASSNLTQHPQRVTVAEVPPSADELAQLRSWFLLLVPMLADDQYRRLERHEHELIARYQELVTIEYDREHHGDAVGHGEAGE